MANMTARDYADKLANIIGGRVERADELWNVIIYGQVVATFDRVGDEESGDYVRNRVFALPGGVYSRSYNTPRGAYRAALHYWG